MSDHNNLVLKSFVVFQNKFQSFTMAHKVQNTQFDRQLTLWPHLLLSLPHSAPATLTSFRFITHIIHTTMSRDLCTQEFLLPGKLFPRI